MPDGRSERLKVRSLVRLIHFCAATTLVADQCEKYPEMQQRFKWFLEERPELVASIHDPRQLGVDGRRLMSVMNEQGLRRVLARMLDENEFLSPHGVRSVPRHHAGHPFVLSVGGQVSRVAYLPAESDSGMLAATRTGVARCGCRSTC